MIGVNPMMMKVYIQPLANPTRNPPNIIPIDMKYICNLVENIYSKASVWVMNSVLKFSI